MTPLAWAVVAVGLVVLALLAAAWWRSRRALARAETRIELLTEGIDHADAALVLYDPDDRLVMASRRFLDLYPLAAGSIRPGRTFEAILRDVAAAGLVPGGPDQVQTWITSRVRMHEDGGTYVRQQADGHWRRITDQRLSDGSRLSFSIDVTDLVTRGHALETARVEAQQARERLDEAIEALPVGFEWFDADDRLLVSNRAMRDLFPRVADLLSKPGAAFEELVRANVAAGGLPGVDADNVGAWLARRLAERAQPSNTSTMRVGARWVRAYERRARDGGLIGVRVDVTESVEQREAAEAARAQLQDAIDVLPEAFALFDREDRLVVFNANYLTAYEASAPAIVLGNTFEAILRFGLERGQYPQAVGREAEWLRERLHRHRHPTGPLLQELPGNRWLRIEEMATRDGGTAGVRSDVTEMVHREQALERSNAELDEARARLEQLSDTDSLTMIANRRLLDRRLLEEWSRARRLGQPLSLLMIDVDHFKRFNDAHGHPAGDACLRRIAAALSGAVRRGSDLVARYGGEEFLVLLPHTDMAGAAKIADACLAAVDAAAIAHGDSPVAAAVTISLGGACAVDPSTGGTPEALLGAADAALFDAKQRGRHRVCLAQPI